MSSHLCQLRCCSLEVQVRDSLYLLRLFLTVHVHHVRWAVKGALLSLLKVELLMSIVELQGKSSNLRLKEANHGLALSNCRLKCVNLALSLILLGIEINNELISDVDHLMVGLCQLS